MYDFEIDILAATFTEPAGEQDFDKPLLNTGDTTDGAGVAAGAAMLGPLGFFGSPNLPTAGGKAARVVQLSQSNERFILGGSDSRDLGALVAALGPGDRAILSACPARLELRQATDKIGLYGGALNDRRIELDSANGKVGLYAGTAKVEATGAVTTVQQGSSSLAMSASTTTVQHGPSTITMTSTGLTITTDNGAGIVSTIVLSASSLVMSYTAASVTSAIALAAGGRVNISAPGGVTVNNIPLLVP